MHIFLKIKTVTINFITHTYSFYLLSNYYMCVYLLGGVAVCVQCVCAVQFTLSPSVEQRHMVAGRLCCTG